MPHKDPDHHDAELMLKVYDLRREAVMRDSRNAINAKFWPQSFEDVQAVLKPDHPLNAAYRQTTSYWEMVYGMAHHGIVHVEYLLENSGEGLLLFGSGLFQTDGVFGEGAQGKSIRPPVVAEVQSRNRELPGGRFRGSTGFLRRCCRHGRPRHTKGGMKH